MATLSMLPGTLLDARFELLDAIGSGGMGTVFKARDRKTGELVAIKVLRGANLPKERFDREVRVLAQLQHPGIVGYVAHGKVAGSGAEDGSPYLAMEFLEGEDLDARLRRKRLDFAETLALGRGIAAALVHAHAQGVVHRDLKPSNVVLAHGDPRTPKLLDFGIALAIDATRALTQTGAVLGTVGYMSPEQASGEAVDRRADFFSLGCILFECATGASPFHAQTPIGILAKILLSDAPRVHEKNRDVPQAFDDLIASLLARDPAHRPSDARSIVAALESLAGGRTSLPTLPAIERPAPVLGPVSMTTAERRIWSIVLVQTPPSADEDATVSDVDRRSFLGPLEEARARYGGQLVTLGPDITALSLEGRGSAVDQAAAAANLALAILAGRARFHVAVATGQVETSSSGPIGPIIDTALRLLASANGADQAVIDDTTRGLVGNTFEILPQGPLHLLVRKKGRALQRLLLGKEVPCLGRERELTALQALVTETIEEGVARATIVTAAPGAGKSRLAEELLSRMRASHRGMEVAVVRAEALKTFSAFGLVRELIQSRAPALVDENTLEADSDTQYPVTLEMALLLELTGERSVEQAMERAGLEGTDPVSMRAAIGRAFEDWVRRETSRRPLMVVIEDLQWADATSVELFGEAFRAVGDRPFALVVLARPEAKNIFPSFAKEVNASELWLSGLSRRASTELVQAALGSDRSQAEVERIVELSDGNAFYLEELTRWLALGGSGALPDSVVAMAQVRLAGLDEEARRTLRAASVVGEAFDAVEVNAVLGDHSDAQPVLARLTKEEVLVRRDNTGKRFAFRHALLQSAAYAMLTETDRAAAHARAARHFAGSPRGVPANIAEHLALAGEHAEAANWFLRAAKAALDSGDLNASRRLVARGQASHPDRTDAGELDGIEAQLLGIVGDWEPVGELSRRAMAALTPGTSSWFRAAASAVFADINLGRVSGNSEILQALVSLDTPPEASRQYGIALSVLASSLVLTGDSKRAQPLLDRIDLAVQSNRGENFDTYRLTTKAFLTHANGDLGVAIEAGRAAVLAAGRRTDLVSLTLPRIAVGRALIDVGRTEEAALRLGEAADTAQKSGMTYSGNFARLLSAEGQLMVGRRSEASIAELERQSLSASVVLRTVSVIALGQLALREGDLVTAERAVVVAEAGAALAFLDARRVLLVALLAQRREDHRAALELLGDPIEGRESAGITIETARRLLIARSQLALGQIDQAREAIEASRTRIDRIAAGLEEEDRKTFFEAVPPNVGTLNLCRELGVE